MTVPSPDISDGLLACEESRCVYSDGDMDRLLVAIKLAAKPHSIFACVLEKTNVHETCCQVERYFRTHVW